MGQIVELETKTRKQLTDLEFNKLLAKKAERYWASKGHVVKFEVMFDPKYNIHYLKTDDLDDRGIPMVDLTPVAYKELLLAKN